MDLVLSSEQEKLDEVMTIIASLSGPEKLKRISDFARQRAEMLSTMEAHAVLTHLGQKVQMKSEHRSRKPYGTIGQIVKFNRAKVKVDFGSMGIWNVPYSMLQPL